MINPSEFQKYLQEICRRYEQWWTEVALTDTIADRQASFSFEQMVQTEEKKTKTEEKPQKISLPIFQGIQNYLNSEHILLVGSPGVGKSTALLRCLIKFAKEELDKLEPRIPVLITLKRYNARFSNSDDPSGILGLIKDTLEPELWLEISEIKKLLFQDKRLILLLDGLNEMPAGIVRTELEEFRKKCDRCNVPLICTTREGGGTLGIKRQLEIQPPSPLEIERFLRECMPSQGQQVLQLLNRDNRELSRTPFVLWMLYQLFQKKGVVVETLGEAFRKFFQSFKKYKKDAPVIDKRREDWNLWLECLAFTMLNSPANEPGLVISDELAEKVLVKRFGDLYGASSRIEELLKYHLLERVSEKEVSFHHQLIQEYYAAECLLPQLSELSKEQLGQKYTQFQIDYLNYLKWTEAIAIMLGLPEITENQVKHLTELALDVDLMLGARLAGAVKSDWQEKTVGLVSAAKLSNDVEVSDWLSIELLGRTQSKLALPKLRQFLKNPNLDIARKAAAWIGFLGYQEAIPDLLQMLSELDRWIPQENGSMMLSDRTVSLEIEIIEALGKLSPEDAVLKLRELFREPPSFLNCFIEPRINDLLAKLDPEFSVEESLEFLENSRDPNRISQASELLLKVGYLDVPSKLIQRLNCEQDSEIHKALIGALGLFDTDEAVSALTSLIKSPDSSIREQAAKTLIKHERVSAIDELISLLDNPDWNIRWCAALVLGKFRSSAAVSILLEGLSDQHNRGIRRTAAEILGLIEHDEVIPRLPSSLQDSDYAVRRSAAISLAQFNRQEAIPELLKALRHYYPSDDSDASIEVPFYWDKDHVIFIKGITHEVLRSLGDHEAIKSWIWEKLNRDIREQVADALGRFNTEEVINALFKSLHKGVKASVFPLGKLGKQEVVPELIELLQDSSQVSSSNKVIDTLVFLASLGNLSIVSQLISILENINDYKHTDFYFPNRVAIVLANIEHEAMISYLPDLVKLLPTQVGAQASWAIASIQSRCQFYNYEITQLSLPKLKNVINEKVERGIQNIYNFPSASKVQVFEQVDKFINHNNSQE